MPPAISPHTHLEQSRSTNSLTIPYRATRTQKSQHRVAQKAHPARWSGLPSCALASTGRRPNKTGVGPFSHGEPVGKRPGTPPRPRNQPVQQRQRYLRTRCVQREGGQLPHRRTGHARIAYAAKSLTWRECTALQNIRRHHPMSATTKARPTPRRKTRQGRISRANHRKDRNFLVCTLVSWFWILPG